MVQTVNNLPAIWETRVQSLGGEDPLEKRTTTHSSVLARRIPWTEEMASYSPCMESQRAGHDLVTNTHTHTHTHAMNPNIFRSVHIIHSFPGSSAGKESACNTGDPSWIPGLGRSAEEGIGYPLQYSSVSLVAQLVRNLHTMWETWETWVQSLG